MIRVLLIDPSSRGGIVAYTTMIAQGLVEAGGAPEILGSVRLDERPDGIPQLRLLPDDRWGDRRRPAALAYPQRLLDWWRAARTIRRQVRRSRPDVVHFQMPINRRLDAILVRRLARRVAVVWTAHNVLPFETTAADRGRFAAIYRAADRVVVHTRPAADAVRELAGVEAAVIDHPVTDRITRVSRDEARRQLGLPETGRVLAALGFIREYKGYGLLAETWERLADEAPLLLVMGELLADSERVVLERLQRTGRADVRTGYLPEAELHTAIAAADAILLPYATASDSGVLHLARALGVPVLASDAPELAASVEAASAGAVVPRTVEAWSEAVTGPLPPPPPAPPDLLATGTAHLEAYRDVLATRSRHRFEPLQLAVYLDAIELGGAEQALAALLEALSPEIRVTIVGVDAHVVAWLAGHRPAAEAVVLRPVRDKRDAAAIREHIRFFRRLRPTILQLNLRHPFSCQYAILAGLLTRGTRVIAVEHNPGVPPADRVQLVLKRLTTRRLAAHVSVSRSSGAKIQSLVGSHMPPVRTIYNGIAEAPPRTPGGSGRRLVGAVGRMVEIKGLDVFLEAIAQVPDAAAMLVGDGPERGRLERLVRELELGDRVELLGWRDDARELIRSFDVLCVPSRVDGLPLVALEAMNAGVPVVASAIGGLPELVVDGETGLLVPPDDAPALAQAIERALDPAVNRAMSEKSREVAHRSFSRETMVRSYEDLYRAVLQ